MKKLITLSEEINRMKSLFTEDRLYGNIVDLITEEIDISDIDQIKKVTLKQPSTNNKMLSDILIQNAPITADVVADGPTGPTPVSIKQVHLNNKNQIIVSGIADVPNPAYPIGPKFISKEVTRELGKIKDVGNKYEWKPNKKIYDQFVAKGTDEQKKVFNAFINGIITDYNFGKAVLAATTKGSNVTGAEIITTWQSSSTPAEKVKPAEEVTEEVEHKGVFMPGTTDVKNTGVVTEKSDTEMKFEYTGPEFYGVDDDPAHALANTAASKVGEQLKSLYDAGIYVQVNLNKITYETTPIKCNKEKWPDTTDESKCINFKISVPFVNVGYECQAFTSIEHGGSWGGNEAEANTTTNKSKAEKINLDGDEFDVSKKIVDNNKKVTEYWFQWRNKAKQEADCSGEGINNTGFPYTVEERKERENETSSEETSSEEISVIEKKKETIIDKAVEEGEMDQSIYETYWIELNNKVNTVLGNIKGKNVQLSTSDGKNIGKFIGVYKIDVSIVGNKNDQSHIPFRIKIKFLNKDGKVAGISTYKCSPSGEEGTLKLHYRDSELAKKAKEVNGGKAVAYVTNPKLLKMLQDGICFEVGLINKLKPLTIRPDADF